MPAFAAATRSVRPKTMRARARGSNAHPRAARGSAIFVSGHEPFDRVLVIERQRFECNGFSKALAQRIESNDLFGLLNERNDDFLRYGLDVQNFDEQMNARAKKHWKKIQSVRGS